MSPEPFKIGEVNNYFSQNDANSIFRADATDNLTEDQKEKKRVEIITEDIEKRLKEQQNQREQLLDQIWGLDSDLEIRTVDVHIRRLRKAINLEGLSALIRTVRSTGYSLD